MMAKLMIAFALVTTLSLISIAESAGVSRIEAQDEAKWGAGLERRGTPIDGVSAVSMFKAAKLNASNEISHETATTTIATLSSFPEMTQSSSSSAISVETVNLDWSKVKQVPTYDQFCSAVDAYSLTKAGGHPPMPSLRAYYNYLDIVARDMTLNEQAMLLANVVWETAGLQFVEEIACKSGNCTYGKYFGRGYIQLTWDYNYRRASFEIYGDDRLLRHPELVAQETDAWKTTLWYWKTHVSPVLKQHDAIDNFLIGYAVMAINGQLECRPKSNARERLRIYNGILKAWHIAEGPVGRMVGCLEEKRPTRARPSESLSLTPTSVEHIEATRTISAVWGGFEATTPVNVMASAKHIDPPAPRLIHDAFKAQS